jgi:predicted PurR-regulated permease PerM
MTAYQTFRNTLIVILTVGAAYALVQSAHILVVLLIALIIASALRPTAERLRRARLPEWAAITLVYVGLAIFIFMLGALVLPPAVQQIGGYFNNEIGFASQIIGANTWLEQTLTRLTGSPVKLADPVQIREAVSQGYDQIGTLLPTLLRDAGAMLAEFILVIVMGIYWLTAREQTITFLLQLFPLGQRPRVSDLVQQIETLLGAYLRGVVTVCLFVGLANFALLTVLGVPNASTLGFIVGLTTALPIIGGYIGAGLAVLMAMLSSPLHALFAFGTFVLVQQVETHYLTPRAMSRSVNLNPILVIVALFVGFSVGGVVGALLSVPIAGTIAVLMQDLVIEPRKREAAPTVMQGGVLLAQPATNGAQKQAPAASDSKPINGVLKP